MPHNDYLHLKVTPSICAHCEITDVTDTHKLSQICSFNQSAEWSPGNFTVIRDWSSHTAKILHTTQRGAKCCRVFTKSTKVDLCERERRRTKDWKCIIMVERVMND